MKGMDVFCASQASTAICRSTDQASSSASASSSTFQLGGKAIDRHNPIIRDSRRTTSGASSVPCSSSQPPIDPKPYHDLQKAKKNSSSKPSDDQKKKNATKGRDQKKKKKNTAEKLSEEHIINNYSSKPIDSVVRRSWARPPADLIAPPDSSRYLLNDMAFLDGLSDYEPVLALTNVDDEKAQVVHQDETNPASNKPSSSPLPKSGSSDQVVVLTVSLHCKGCEGKVRKHLSRMQGVKSFSIDFAAKKVTVVGEVTPLSVMASISKVKTAQFWPASALAVGSAISETNRNN